MHSFDQGKDYEILPSPFAPPEPLMPSFLITLLLALIVVGEKLGSLLEAFGDRGATLLYSNRVARYALAMTTAVGVGLVCYALAVRTLG